MSVPSTAGQILPDTLNGLSLENLREDHRRRLFDQYLPFWEKGSYDRDRGGFMCELNEDGSLCSDEKFIWFQGRAVWVYAYLYRHFGRDPHWLDIAARTRQFMVKHMYAGQGKWYEKVHADGTLIDGIGGNVYGWFFAAAGLVQLYLAAGDHQDLELARQSIEAAGKSYDDPAYADQHTTRYASVKIPQQGLRTQGHSMVLVWLLTELLSAHEDQELEKLQRTHVDYLVHRFWNADYGISNEYLRHDYSRIPGAESHMYAGHSLESLWILLHEALRLRNHALFDTAKTRIRRLVEMCWDYVFEGWSSENYFVFDTSRQRLGTDYEVKTMWAHCEILIACLSVLEYTGESWARDWFDRACAYTLKTMPAPKHGVWRQAVDRFGKDVQRVGYSTKRKDNFHQVRMLMMNLLCLDRMIGNHRKITPFPQ
jgi:N-acylglucosamine 2-epimerase